LSGNPKSAAAAAAAAAVDNNRRQAYKNQKTDRLDSNTPLCIKTWEDLGVKDVDGDSCVES